MGVNKKRKEEIEYYLSEKNLKHYLEIYSANYIATKLFAPNFITTAGTVIDRARNFNILTKGFKSSLLPSVRESYKNTCIKNYGCINVSQSENIKNKKKQSAQKKYGVDNVFQAREIKEKSKQTMLEKYGISHPTFKKGNSKRSKFHQKIENLLQKLNIEYKSEVVGLCKKYNTYLNRDYSPIVDIFLYEYNIIIECYGDFWHANPKFYKKSDIFYTYEGKKTAVEIWEKDNARIEQIQSFDYKVMVIWESDFNSNKQTIERKILNEIKNCKTYQNKTTK